MITAQRDEFATLLVGDEPVEYGTGVGAAIDVIPQRDDDILGLERHERGQGRERLETTVNVTNGQIAHVTTSFRLGCVSPPISLLSASRPKPVKRIGLQPPALPAR